MTEFLGVTDVPPRVVIRLAGSTAYLAGIIGNVAIVHHRDRTRPSVLGEQVRHRATRRHGRGRGREALDKATRHMSAGSLLMGSGELSERAGA